MLTKSNNIGIVLFLSPILAEINFFKDTNFNGHIYGAKKIALTCQTLTSTMWQLTRSLDTQKCVVLFAGENCQGFNRTFEAGKYPKLTDFSDMTISYRACDNPGLLQEYRIKLFEEFGFENLILDEEITTECTTLHPHFQNNTRSVITSRCVILFAGEYCNGEESKLLKEGEYRSLGAFSDKLVSFQPCNVEDVRQIKITAKITGFEVFTEEATNATQAPKTTFEVVKNSKIFRNVGMHHLLQQYSTEVPIQDSFLIRSALNQSTVHGIKLNELAAVNFSSDFINSLHNIYRKNQLGGHFHKIFKINHFHQKGTAIVKNSTELKSEESAFALEVIILKDKIAQVLKNSSSANWSCMASFNDSVSIPACSELEVSSVIKSTKQFIASYFTYAEITGVFAGTAVPLPASQIRKRWKGLNYEMDKDEFTATVKEKYWIVVDYTWYIAWVGNMTPLEHPNGNSGKICGVQINSNNSPAWFYFIIFLMIVLISVPVFIGLYLINQKMTRFTRILTKQDIRDFKEGLKEESVTNQVNSVSYTRPLALPYDDSLEIPKKDFEIYEVLGEGAFGLVCRANIKGVGEVAVKMTKPNSPSTTVLGFLSEIKLLSYIRATPKNENVISIVGAYTAEVSTGVVYIATELCTLGSLKGYLDIGKMEREDLQSNPEVFLNADGTARYVNVEPGSVQTAKVLISLVEMLRWSFEIASGMEFLAKKHVVHADLATRNVLLNVNKICKISDFGLSRRMENYTNYVKTQQEPLPWRWMAPESLKRLEFSSKSDVWGFGVTLFEIFTLGDQPYPGLSWTPGFVNELYSGMKLECHAHASPQLYEIMKTCWTLEPNERPTFTGLRQEFYKFLSIDYLSIVG